MNKKDLEQDALADEIVALMAEDEPTKWTSPLLYEQIDKAIIGNENYKRTLSMVLADYLGGKGMGKHMLVVGPTGTGKTYLLKKILPLLGVPHKIIDAASLTGSGYKGTNLLDTLQDFFKDQVGSKKNILVLDEFDKISDKVGNNWCHQVQSELLTLLEGRQEGAVDTRNSLWICLGAFAYTEEMQRHPPRIAEEDLKKYSFKPELIGRFGAFTMTDIPTPKEVVLRILNDEQFKSFYADCERDGKNVEIDKEAITEIVRNVMKPDFGMRVLPKILFKLRTKIVYEVQESQFIVTKEFVQKCL